MSWVMMFPLSFSISIAALLKHTVWWYKKDPGYSLLYTVGHSELSFSPGVSTACSVIVSFGRKLFFHLITRAMFSATHARHATPSRFRILLSFAGRKTRVWKTERLSLQLDTRKFS